MPISFRLLENSHQTLSAQIQQQVELAIASGELAIGETIPSVRQLAIELKINPNTVAGALQQLVQVGTLISQRGRSGGYRVASVDVKLSDNERKRQLQLAAQQFVASTRSLSYSPETLTRAITDLINKESV
jgi:GntR family transcriptional regulator